MSVLNHEYGIIRKADFENNLNLDSTIWEDHLDSGKHFLIFGAFLAFFGIILAPLGLFILLPSGILLIYFQKKIIIEFTASSLKIRKRLLGKTRKFKLSDIYKIEIVIIKRKIYYHSKSGNYNAILKFKIAILTDIKHYKYNYIYIFRQKKKSAFKGYKEAKEKAKKNENPSN
ncbi:MAG: hypothetical protein ACFFAN_11000 [Promethearchaeota archaeon]